MRIYLDNCCYSRIDDNQNQTKIIKETEAILIIQDKIVEGKIELATSYMLHYENNQNTDEIKKQKNDSFFKKYRKIHIGIEYVDKLEPSIKKIMSTGIKVKDATHVASSILAKCDYFVTVDERVLKYKSNEIKILNPIDFVEILEVNGNDNE